MVNIIVERYSTSCEAQWKWCEEFGVALCPRPTQFLERQQHFHCQPLKSIKIASYVTFVIHMHLVMTICTCIGWITPGHIHIGIPSRMHIMIFVKHTFYVHLSQRLFKLPHLCTSSSESTDADIEKYSLCNLLFYQNTDADRSKVSCTNLMEPCECGPHVRVQGLFTGQLIGLEWIWNKTKYVIFVPINVKW